jgi:mannose-1-phosphate guanylyltransferase
MSDSLWTVILAAGAGRRLASVTGGVPKQFWRGASGRSLLDHTLDRFAPLAPTSRTVVIVDETHRGHIDSHPVAWSSATVVYQPQDRGTAAGVMLALMPVLTARPDALVAVTPSDHGVLDEGQFREGVRAAARHAADSDDIVLFGVEPSAARTDYGWITPGPKRPSTFVCAVEGFVEKPAPEMASHLFATGSVWNTMVVVARASRIRDLCFALLPVLADVFGEAMTLPADTRQLFLREVYPSLPVFDFSRHVLTPAPGLSTYVWPDGVGWSDLGTPERLDAWHQQASRAESVPAA